MARNLFTAFETQDVDDSGDDFDIPHEDLASNTSSESDSDSQSQDLDPGRSGQCSRSNTADCFGWIPITRSLNNGWGCKPQFYEVRNYIL